jgi:hypothetical protein
MLVQQTGPPTPPTIQFNQQDAHPVSVSPFSFSSSQCDAQGDVFFDLAGPIIEVGNILRVSQDGQRVDRVRLPADLGDEGELHFSVDPDGTLYAIFSHADDHRLIQFSSSNEEVRRISLQLPPSFHPRSFAVSHNGSSMIFGSVPVNEPSPATNQTPLTVWLDPDGRLIRKTVQGKNFDLSSDLTETLIASGRLNTFIATTASTIEISSPRGELLHTFPLLKPTKDSNASSLQLVNGVIAVDFAYPEPSASGKAESANKAEKRLLPYFGPLAQTWLLVNAINGEPEGFYQMPHDFVGSALCYSGNHEFLYLQAKDGHPSLVRASKFP